VPAAYLLIYQRREARVAARVAEAH
jgi:hypothetical protein